MLKQSHHVSSVSTVFDTISTMCLHFIHYGFLQVFIGLVSVLRISDPMRLLLPFSFPDIIILKHHNQLLLLHWELLFGFLWFESLVILDHGCCQRSVSWRKSRLDRMSRKLGFSGHISHLFQKRKTILCSIWTEGKLDALTYRHLLRSKVVLGKCRGLQKLNSC